MFFCCCCCCFLLSFAATPELLIPYSRSDYIWEHFIIVKRSEVSSSFSLSQSLVPAKCTSSASPTPVEVGSGSGLGSGKDLSPDETPPSPSPTSPTCNTSAGVLITLNIPAIEYRYSLEYNFTALIVQLLSDENITNLVVGVDIERSSENSTVVIVCVKNDEGVVDDKETERAFKILESSSNTLWQQYMMQYVSNSCMQLCVQQFTCTF